VQAVRDVVARLPVVVRELDTETSVVAAGLRAAHGRRLPLPDAVVVATAIRDGAETLVTTDRGWPPADELGYAGRVIVLKRGRSWGAPARVHTDDPKPPHGGHRHVDIR
jgi:hypothetical protein